MRKPLSIFICVLVVSTVLLFGLVINKNIVPSTSPQDEEQMVSNSPIPTAASISDGSKATWYKTSTGYRLNSLVHDDRYLVIVGDGGLIRASAMDAQYRLLMWYQVPHITDHNLNKIIYCNSKFICVGDSGIILSSSNGVDWVSENSGLKESLKGIAFGDDKYVVVGEHSTIAYSTDGTSWVSASFEDKRYEFNDIIWDGKKFTAIGVYHDDRVDSGIILSSVDGVEWSLLPVNSNYAIYKSIAANKSATLIINNSEYCDFDLLASYDGTSWAESNKRISKFQLNKIIWDGQWFVAVGYNNEIYRSKDGLAWEKFNYSDSSKYTLNDVIRIDNQYIFIGSDSCVIMCNMPTSEF